MSKKNKYKPLSEFKFNKGTQHINYVFGTNGKKNKSLGITSESTTFGKSNMPLKFNIEEGKVNPSYIRNGVISDHVYMYKDTYKIYKFDKSDLPNIKSKIRNYKKKNKKFW